MNKKKLKKCLCLILSIVFFFSFCFLSSSTSLLISSKAGTVNTNNANNYEVVFYSDGGYSYAKYCYFMMWSDLPDNVNLDSLRYVCGSVRLVNPNNTTQEKVYYRCYYSFSTYDNPQINTYYITFGYPSDGNCLYSDSNPFLTDTYISVNHYPTSNTSLYVSFYGNIQGCLPIGEVDILYEKIYPTIKITCFSLVLCLSLFFLVYLFRGFFNVWQRRY